jgi:hypothetical protein
VINEQHLRIVEFCAEEVRRQGDSPLEVFGMVDAWSYAQLLRNNNPLPKLTDVKELGRLILQTKLKTEGFVYARPYRYNLLDDWYMVPSGWRAVEVQIGSRRGTNPSAIDYAMEEWEDALHNPDKQMMLDLGKRRATEQGILERFKHLNPDFAACAYLTFEHVHPFPDGNGRTGKIIYNWVRGSLDEPEFPPNFWGINNP